MRKGIKILGKVFSVAVLLLIILPMVLSLLLDIPAVQNYVVQKAVRMVSRKLETTVSIDRVDIGLFSRVKIKGFYVEDYQRDTLLYVGSLDAYITGLGIFGGGVVLSRGEIGGAKLYLRETPEGEMNIKQIVNRISDPDKPRKGNFRLSLRKASIEGMDLCLERLTRRDPEFGIDFSHMHLYGISARVGDYTIDGHSIYTSPDLKRWTYESHVTGFWECPELFELPVDGDPGNTKWVMYGASGTYMLGSFDGRVFRPESGKHCYTSGSIYAAQTYTNIPAADGRRIQIGWGRISHPGMPFKGMMTMPTELTLRTTKDGVRLVSTPVAELDRLFRPLGEWRELTAEEAGRRLEEFGTADRLRIRTTIELSHTTDASLTLSGQPLVAYDMNHNTLNGRFYSPQDPTSMRLTADIYIDRTSVEVFIDGGLYSYSMERRPEAGNDRGFRFRGKRVRVCDLEVFSVESIWQPE